MEKAKNGSGEKSWDLCCRGKFSEQQLLLVGVNECSSFFPATLLMSEIFAKKSSGNFFFVWQVATLSMAAPSAGLSISAKEGHSPAPTIFRDP